jgi:hypothetical protein
MENSFLVHISDSIKELLEDLLYILEAYLDLCLIDELRKVVLVEVKHKKG